jgi:hypothetical protein
MADTDQLDQEKEEKKDQELTAKEPNSQTVKPEVLKPIKVSLGEAFRISNKIDEQAVLRRVLIGGNDVLAKGKIGIAAGKRISIQGEGLFYYDRVALVTERTKPVELTRDSNNLSREGVSISFDFPDIGTIKDRFWILLSGAGVQPVIFKRALVLVDEAQEEKEEAEAQKKKSQESENEEGRSSSARSGSGSNGPVMAVAEELMGGIANAAKEGAQLAMGSRSGESSEKENGDDVKALNKKLLTWKNEYNESPDEFSGGGSVEIETEGGDAELSEEVDTTLESSVSGLGGVSSSTTVNVSAALPSFSPKQQQSVQKISVDLSQRAYSNVRNSVSATIKSNPTYVEARIKAIQELQWQSGGTDIQFPEDKIHEATISQLRQTNPEIIEKYSPTAGAVYDKPEQDPVVQNMRAEVSRQVEGYMGSVALSAEQQNELRPYLTAQIENQVMGRFAVDFPEKAASYKNKIPALANAMRNTQPQPSIPKIPESGAKLPAKPADQKKEPGENAQKKGPDTPPDTKEDSGNPQGSLPHPLAEKPVQALTPQQKEAEGMVEKLRKKNQPADAAARSMGAKPKGNDKKSSGSPVLGNSVNALPDAGKKFGKNAGTPGAEEPSQKKDGALPAPLQMPDIPDGQKTDGQPPAGTPEEKIEPEQGAKAPEIQPPAQPESTPIAPQPKKKLADVENAAESLLDAMGPAGVEAEKKAMGVAFWWLAGFSWAIIPIFIFDIYWVFFHARKKRLWPLSLAQKATIVILNALLFFLVIGIIAFLVQGCKSLSNYHLDEVLGGRLCQIADAFKNGGLSGGFSETANPSILTGGPISVAQWNSDIIAAANANGLPNACVLRTIVAKESGGNKNAVSSTCGGMTGYKIENHNNPPFYDLDWACGHAFGLTQIYIYPQNGTVAWQDSNTPSRNLFNHYYTIPELLDSGTNMNLGARYFANLLRSNPNINLSAYAQGLSSDDQLLWKAYRRYNGSGAAAEGYADDSMRRYSTCKTTGY